MSYHTHGVIAVLLLLSSARRLRAQAPDPGQREVRVRVEFASRARLYVSST